jgi:hypothetical protein
MRFDILIPHFKTGKMTAYTVSKLIRFKGRHDIRIIISDNNAGDGSIEALAPFKEYIEVYDHPKDIMHSHGTSLDRLVPLVTSDYFIAIESDAYPTKDNWLDYYENLIKKGYESAGSLLKLSGGEFVHAAGAMYKTSNWHECKKYCDEMPYKYLPHIAMENNFPHHLMIHNDTLEYFINNPEEFVELHESYKGNSAEELLKKIKDYSPVCGPLHDGRGYQHEEYDTYGQRNIYSGPADFLMPPNSKFYLRMGEEPGQFFCYWHLAMSKKVFFIPTHTVWMNGRINEQQEFTIMENGFKHTWGVSSFHNSDSQEFKDVVIRKREIVDKLYDSLPANEKVL